MLSLVHRLGAARPAARRAFAAQPEFDWRKTTPREAFAHGKETVFRLVRGLNHVRLETVEAVRARQRLRDTPTRRDAALVLRNSRNLKRMLPFLFVVMMPGPTALYVPFVLVRFPAMLPAAFLSDAQKTTVAQNFWKNRKEAAVELAHGLDVTGAARGISHPEDADFAALLDIAHRHEVNVAEMSREDLQAACKVASCGYLALRTSVLRRRLSRHMAYITEDDRMLEIEGIDDLTDVEVREACRERAIGGGTEDADVDMLRRRLATWVEWSTTVPGSSGERTAALMMASVMDVVAAHHWEEEAAVLPDKR